MNKRRRILLMVAATLAALVPVVALANERWGAMVR